MELIGGLAEMMETRAPKAYFDGAERICSPSQTMARIRPHLGRCGITRLADITGLDRLGLPVVQAVRPMSRSLSVKQGKGRNLPAAFVSGAMEAIEAWHAENIPNAAFRPMPRKGCARADLRALSLNPGLDPSLLSLHWAVGLDLISGAATAVPRDLVSLDFTQPKQYRGFQKSSNGLASGNALAEAVCAALYEVIERDAVAEFDALSAQAKSTRRLPQKAFAAYGAGDLLAQADAAGIMLECWDITSDTGVPAFRAVLYDLASGPPGDGSPWVAPPQMGFGCHLNPGVALSRAITEAAQSRLVLIAGSRDDLAPQHYIAPRDGNRMRLLGELADLSGRARAFDPRPSQAAAYCEADLATLTERLRAARAGQVILLDLTDPAMGIPVVRAVCPGLGRLIPGDGSQRGARHWAENVGGRP